MPLSSTVDHTASLVLYFFNQLSRYPRQSRKEDAIRNFITHWARQHSYHTVVDRIGNCIITVPADTEKRQSPPLALQAHFDMVCESTQGHSHDFSKDPIIPHYEDDWVRADNTTLGADNGIGIALALALCEDPLVVHPQLELVFTVDEETGLTGAAQLDKNAINAKHLLNLDSEDGQVLINGCAGGINLHICKPYQLEQPHKRTSSTIPVAYCLQISGLQGGHSGVDIHKPLGNALCCTADILAALLAALPDQCHLGQISGGTVHNAIPRDCTVELLLSSATVRSQAERIIKTALKQYATTHSLNDKDMKATLQPTKKQFSVRTKESSSSLIALLTELPHGVHSFTNNPNIPQTSSNVAQIEMKHSGDCILISLRGSNHEELTEFTGKFDLLTKQHAAECDHSGSYPAWHPHPNSRLLTRCEQAYKKTCGTLPQVEVIHAGLETAVIANVSSNLDMLSCGPLILNPHSPQERLSISSTADIYRMLVQLLKDW